ncbi:hypothetical protein M8J77_018417 [Diaphorina citri]|nr:hypothetical protein M8J77_018417 [Diaphorina citri]
MSITNMNSPTVAAPTARNIGPILRICQINVEGISIPKSKYLEKFLRDNKIDVAAIQETHSENEEDLRRRGSIEGFDLIGATYSKTYGIATYVRSDIENAALCSTSTSNDIHVVVVKIGETRITNLYKPPSTSWPPNIITIQPHPSVYIGDFNSHHAMWKYAENDENGERLAEWSDLNNIHLVFDAKDLGTFKSAAWRRDYNPDLCFVSTNENNQPLHASRKVISQFPRSQHRPVIVQIGISIPLVTSFPRPRWNFQKADWVGFADGLDKCLGWIPPITDNYQRFCGAVLSTAKKYIPRGFRKDYIPGWNEQSEQLYRQFLETEDQEIGSELLASLDLARRVKWTKTVENLDFTKSSSKAWSLLGKLSGGNKAQRKAASIKPNQIANHIVNTSRAPRNRQHTIDVKRMFKSLKSSCSNLDEYSGPVSICDINIALEETKINKAPGFDGIHPEFLKYCGTYTRKWLALFYTDIFLKGKIPGKLKASKIIALLKPGKPEDTPQSYRPIALLNCLYKLLERIIYNRVSPKIFEAIPICQAGFRPNRDTTPAGLRVSAFPRGRGPLGGLQPCDNPLWGSNNVTCNFRPNQVTK